MATHEVADRGFYIFYNRAPALASLSPLFDGQFPNKSILEGSIES